MVGNLLTLIRQDVDSLKEILQNVHTDLKNPIIVKRLF